MSKITATILKDGKEFSAHGAELDLVPALQNIIDKSKTYSLSVDQSTTCSGLYLVSSDMEFRLIIDFERLQTEKKRFISQIRRLISNLVAGLTIERMLIEEPVRHAKFRYSGDVLRELKGVIEQLQFDVPELENVVLESILPQTWKAQIIDSSKGTGRFNDKRCVVEDLIDMFPDLCGHYSRCPSKDTDSFDAIGIYHGYMKRKFDENGDEKNFGQIENRHVSRYYALYVDKEYEDLLEEITPAELRKNGSEIYTYDTSVTFYKNIKYASTKGKQVILKVTDMDMILNLAFRFDFDYDQNKILILYVYRKSHVSKSAHLELKDKCIWMFDEMA